MRSKLSNNLDSLVNKFRIGLITFILLLLPCSASFAWKCTNTYRCTNYNVCLFDGLSMGCSYGSSSAVSGGLTFENGTDLFIEWVFYEDGIRFDVRKENIALVNGVRTKVLNFGKSDCVKFTATEVNPSFAYGSC